MRNILSGALLSGLVVIMGCASSLQTLKNVKQGESIAGSQNGLLVGAFLLRQGEKTVTLTGAQGSGETFQIKNIATGQTYSHKIEGTADVKDIDGYDFRLPLTAGQYSLLSLTATGVNVNETTMSKASPWLMNILTLPLGVVSVPGNSSINLPTPFSSFEIKPREVTYIGTLIIEIPDPLPNGRFRPQYKVLNEETQTTAELRTRIPGIEKVVTALVAVQLPAQTPGAIPDSNPKTK